MKIVAFQAHNIFSYDTFIFDDVSPELNVIVGPNNSGKTGLIRVLRLIKDAVDNEFRVLSQTNYNDLLNNRETSENFDVSLKIAFDKDEIKLISDFLDLSLRLFSKSEIRNNFMQPQMNRTPRLAEEFRKAKLEGESLVKIKEWYVNFLCSCAQDFARIISSMLEAGSVNFSYDGSATKLSFDFKVVDELLGSITLNSQYIESMPGRGYVHIQEQLLEQIAETLRKNEITQKELVDLDQNKFNARLRGLLDIEAFLLNTFKDYNLGTFETDSSGIKGSDSSELRSILERISVEPKINVRYTIGWLIFRIVSDSLIFTDEFRSRPIGNLNTELLGTRGAEILSVPDLAVQLHCLRNGGSEDQKKFQLIQRSFETLFPHLTITVGVKRHLIDDVKKEQSTLAEVIIEDNQRKTRVPLHYTGSGIVETIYLLVYLLGFKNRILLLDEPSSHLHPTKQRGFSDLIEKAAKKNQILLITHSPYLINSSKLEQTVAFRLEGRRTRLWRPHFNNVSEREETIRWFDLDPNIPAALFSNKVILVDGGEEERALPIWFKKLGVDLEALNVSLFNTHCDSNLPTYRRIMKLWGVPTVVICDQKALPKLGELASEEIFQLREDDFAEYLKKTFGARYSEARKMFGDAKPIVAAYIASNEAPPSEIRQLLHGKLRAFLAS